MDLVKSAISFLTFRRFYRYLLKRVLGGVFVADFSVDQLDVQLFNGEVQLTDLAVNTVKVNALLDATSVPFSIESGHVRKIHVKIPWKSILHDKCKVYLSELYLKIRIRTHCNLSSSPLSSIPSSSLDIASLSKLVRQVVMNAEGYMETVIVDCILGDSVYRVNFTDISVSPDSCTSIQRTSIELISPINVSPILLISRIECLQIARTLKISTDLISIDIKNELVWQYLVDSITFILQSSDDIMFQSVIEPSPSNRLWYEELYTVIEAEVIKGESESPIHDEFLDPQSIEESESIEEIVLNIGETRTSIFRGQSDFPAIFARFFNITASSNGTCSIKEYSLEMDLPNEPTVEEFREPSLSMYLSQDDRVSSSSDISSFDSVLTSSSEESSVEEMSLEERFFTFGLNVLNFPQGRSVGNYSCSGEYKILKGHKFLYVNATCIEFPEKLVFTLTPISISSICSLGRLKTVLLSNNGDQSKPIVFSKGFTFNLGSISICLEHASFQKTEVVIPQIAVLLDKNIALSIADIRIGRIISVIVKEEVHAIPKDTTGWTAITTRGIGLVPVISTLNVLPKHDLEKVFVNEIFLKMDKVSLTNDAMIFLDLQLKIQSLVDQLVLPTNIGENQFSGINVFLNKVCLSPLLVLNRVMIRTITAGSAPLIVLVDSLNELGPSDSNFDSSPQRVIDKIKSFNGICRVDLVNTKCTVSISNTQLHVSSTLMDLVRFFAPPVILVSGTAPLISACNKPPTFTLYTVKVHNSWIAVDNVPGGLLLNDTEVSFGLLATIDISTPVAVSIKIGEFTFWLSNEEGEAESKTVYEWREGVAGLRLRGLVPIGKVQNCEGRLKWEGTDILCFENFSIGQIRLDLKADSYVGLSVWADQLIAVVSNLVDMESPPVVTLPPELLAKPSAPAVLHVDDGWIQGRGGSRFANRPKPPPTASGSSRWFVDPKTLRVINDHLVDRKDGSEQLRIAEKRVRLSNGLLKMIGVDLRVKSVLVYFTGGLDWHGTEYHLGSIGNTLNHHQTDYLCVDIGSANVSLVSVMSKTSKEVFLNISIASLAIRDGVCGSVFANLLHGSSGMALSFKEGRLGITVHPLTVSVDQDTLEFINTIVRETTRIGFSELDLEEHEIDNVSEVGELEEVPEVAESRTEDRHTVVSDLFQLVQISAVQIEVNYKSKRVSMSRLRQGDPLQLLNLLPLLEGLKIRFSPIKLSDVSNAFTLAERVTACWLKDIDRAQVLSSLKSMKPIRSLTNLSAGVKELINQPLKQLRRGKHGHLSRGVLRGVSSFVRTLTIESLNLADVLVSSAQGTLEMIDHLLETHEEPDELVWEDDEDWTTVERGAGRSDPSSAIEGFLVGSEALRRGIGMARLGPSLVLKPAIGTTQAVSDVLRGARSTVDSGQGRAESQRKFKGPWIAGSND